MILLDTHIFFWWVDNPAKLTKKHFAAIKEQESKNGLGVSAISLWEIAKLHQKKRIALTMALADWFNVAVQYPGIQIISLSKEIIVDSVQLPEEFHNDSADQLIVSTARIMNLDLLTLDTKILNYSHVNLMKP